MVDLLRELGVKNSEAIHLAEAEEALNEDELHILRIVIETLLLGEGIGEKKERDKTKKKSEEN